MPKNKIDDLNNHLFECMEMLKCGDMDLETAKGVAQLGQVIINATKLKADFIKSIAGLGADFVLVAEKEIKQLLDENL